MVNLTAQPFIVLLLYRVESKPNKKQFTELTQTDMLHTIQFILQAGEDKKQTIKQTNKKHLQGNKRLAKV